MVSDADYETRGIPTHVLGRNLQWRKMNDMESIIKHYEKSFVNIGMSKMNLFHKLDSIIKLHNLGSQQRMLLIRSTGKGSQGRLPTQVARSKIQKRAKPANVSVVINSPRRTATGITGRATSAGLSVLYDDTDDTDDLTGAGDILGPLDGVMKLPLEMTPLDTNGGELCEGSTSVPSDAIGSQAQDQEHGVRKLDLCKAVVGKQCSVCLDVIEESSAPPRRVTAACRHDPLVYLDCFSRHIATQFHSNKWDHVSCPICNKDLNFHDIQAFAQSEIFAKYDKLFTKKVIDGDPTFCRCSAPGCEHAGWCYPQVESFVTCICGQKTCLTCETEWHPELTCAEKEEQREEVKKENIEASEEFLQKEAKLCPNTGCRAWIQKNRGCDHMKCSNCKYQYCWVCNVAWDKIPREENHAHLTSCKHHRRLPLNARP